jgi:predicted RNase H-like nuclease
MEHNMPRIAGIDGCPGGWLCIVLDTDMNTFRVSLFRLASKLLAHDPFIHVMTIDMPIGLASNGRRRCDEMARDLLGDRHVCVQNAPVRPALFAPSRLAASAVTQATANRGVGSNEWALYPKIINLDVAITPLHQRWCFEIHPEVSFYGWNDGVPIPHAKDTDPGRQAREALIDAAWPNVRPNLLTSLQQQGISHEHYALDDLNDAFAALWTARRIYLGQAYRIPESPDIDERGLRMEMWY